MNQPVGKPVGNQEIFDRVLTHLRAQGVASFSPEINDCAYRAQAGLMCAIGCLIPDDLYSPAMEGRSARTLAFLDLIPANLFTAESVPLLVDLQMAHDTWMPHELGRSLQRWECSMEDIAIEHGLTYTTGPATSIQGALSPSPTGVHARSAVSSCS